MAEKTTPFVVTDRRKFTNDGEPRESNGSADALHDGNSAPASPNVEPRLAQEIESQRGLSISAESTVHTSEGQVDAADPGSEEKLEAPTQEQMEQSQRAFQATADRLDVAIRSANPGGDHPPALTFESLIQSVYMQAVLQLGGGAQQGEQPQVDLLGARQSIDMLGILLEKTRGNTSAQEDILLASAVFELRLAFLEMTQALARSASQRSPEAAPSPGPRLGPSIVR